MPPTGGDKIISSSALSITSVEITSFPSVFHSSNNPPTSSPIDLAGGPSMVTIDFPLPLCPVTILLILIPHIF